MVNEGWSSDKNVMLGRSNSKEDVQNNNNSLDNELELSLLQNEHQERQGNLNLFGGGGGERDQSLHRSGSAPPTVDGAFSSAGSMLQDPNFASHGGGGGDRGVLSEEEIRSHPAYLAYYYSNENLNPRLPPPLLSREDWRIAQRVQAGGPSIGGFGDLRYNNFVGEGGNLMLLQPQLSLQKVEDDLMELRKAAVRNLSLKNSTDFLEGSSSGLQKPALGSRKKSFADIVQGGGSPATSSGHLSRPSSHNSIGDALPISSVAGSSSSELQNIAELAEASRHRQPLPGSSRSAVIPGTFPSARESLPWFPALLGQVSVEDELRFLDAKLRDLSTNDRDISHLLASFPGSEGAALHSPTHMPLSNGHNQNLHQHFVHNSGAHNLLNAPNYDEFAWGNGLAPQANYHSINFDREMNVPRRSASLANLQSRFNPSEFAMGNQGFHSGTNPNGHGLWRSGIPSHSNLHSPAALPRNHSLGKGYIGSSHPDLHELDRMYIESLLAQQQQQQLLQLPLFYNPGNINHQPGNPGFGQHVIYRGNQMVNSFHPTFDSEIYNFLNEQILRMPGTLKNQVGGSPRSRSPVSTLLEELKNTKGRPPELSDVIDHVVELSMDQYGSRFIQQKLETASTEDRFKIFSQIIAHARGLMTHVFGNYVMQKLFEHGTESQTKDLANQLVGHVLPLSLQMYGCRVIQKALEVVDADQQMQLVSELKGSVMKCVHDQNGNHVIQKCIERIPHERIQFIITTFYGQVVTLSIHPYGCRVIQRVLEHSADPNTQKTILDEIMESVCTLAQDQYGNYVIQHVMQHGKPHDRSEIIAKLAGQIVKMSQQKFASNVIEKCLTFGSPEQRQLLINEMLGSTEENEPLQAMMKDPFGNYVVQKVLETCDDQSRELIISRIKVHLYTLKKVTYGKHIFSRIEKLISSGEKHMGVSST